MKRARSSGARDRLRAEGNSTAADRVFARIVSEIFTGVIRPRDAISERDLVERYGVSRTPVREAIKRLFERGFLDWGAKRVAVVKEINQKDMKGLYDLRLHLEARAAALTAKHVTAAELARLREINRDFNRAYRARELGQMLDVRAQFHATLVQATRNRWLAKTLITLRDEAYAVRHAHWQDPERAGQAIRMHREMIDALVAGRVERYRELVLRQIRDGLDTYLSRLHATPLGRSPAGRTTKRLGG